MLGLRNEVRSARLLATNKRLKSTSGSDGLTIDVPAEPLDPIATVLVLEVKGKLDIEKVLPGQAADGSVTLSAELADLHGGVQVETIDGQPNVGWWTNPRDFVSWSFQVTRPGRFDVTVAYASPADSKFEIAAGDRKMPAATGSTGGYQKFETVKLGTIELKPGAVELTLKPQEGWQAINLRSVVLKPAD